MKTTRLCFAALAACLMFAGQASAQEVVFQDNFDIDGLATNTGTGGGFSQFTITGSLTDDGNLTAPSTGHNGRGNFLTQNSFDLTGGFTLTASFDVSTGASVSGNASRAAIGLAPSTVAQARNGGIFGLPDTIAVNTIQVPDPTLLGLFYEGTQLDSTLAVDAVAGFEDVVLSVAANGLDYTYSIGGASVSGTLASAFDFSQEYRVEGIFQDAESFGTYESITLEVGSTTSVPEPTSLALLGLGAIGLVTRRRR